MYIYIYIHLQNKNIEFHLVSPFFSKVNQPFPMDVHPAAAGGRGPTTWANLGDQSDAPGRDQKTMERSTIFNRKTIGKP